MYTDLLVPRLAYRKLSAFFYYYTQHIIIVILLHLLLYHIAYFMYGRHNI